MQNNEKYESVADEQDMTQSEALQDTSAAKTPESQELENLKKERDSLYDRLLRKQAEFENYKKRIDREKTEFMQFASLEVMKGLLNTLDSFDLALQNAAAAGPGSEVTLKGFELIYKQLQDTLSRFGLKPVESKGQKFDPNYHQAVSTEASEDVEENTVIQEMRKGYTLNGRLIRPAMVSVSVKKG